MLYALERDGKSDFTFQGQRLGFGEYGIGAKSEWDRWTQVVIYRSSTDGRYIVHICRKTRSRDEPDKREVATYQTAELLHTALLHDQADVSLVQAVRIALAIAVSKDPSLDDAPNQNAA